MACARSLVTCAATKFQLHLGRHWSKVMSNRRSKNNNYLRNFTNLVPLEEKLDLWFTWGVTFVLPKQWCHGGIEIFRWVELYSLEPHHVKIYPYSPSNVVTNQNMTWLTELVAITNECLPLGVSFRYNYLNNVFIFFKVTFLIF